MITSEVWLNNQNFMLKTQHMIGAISVNLVNWTAKTLEWIIADTKVTDPPNQPKLEHLTKVHTNADYKFKSNKQSKSTQRDTSPKITPNRQDSKHFNYVPKSILIYRARD